MKLLTMPNLRPILSLIYPNTSIPRTVPANAIEERTVLWCVVMASDPNCLRKRVTTVPMILLEYPSEKRAVPQAKIIETLDNGIVNVKSFVVCLEF